MTFFPSVGFLNCNTRMMYACSYYIEWNRFLCLSMFDDWRNRTPVSHLYRAHIKYLSMFIWIFNSQFSIIFVELYKVSLSKPIEYMCLCVCFFPFRATLSRIMTQRLKTPIQSSVLSMTCPPNWIVSQTHINYWVLTSLTN